MVLLVRDYAEAIRFYTEKLDFDLVEDIDERNKKMGIGSALTSHRMHYTFWEAAIARQGSSTGNQTGRRVFLFLRTDGFGGIILK